MSIDFRLERMHVGFAVFVVKSNMPFADEKTPLMT